MKTLENNQLNLIAGGDNLAVVIPSTVTTIQVPAASSVVITDVCFNYNVTTPVYDSWGYYVGSVVDSYQTCTAV